MLKFYGLLVAAVLTVVSCFGYAAYALAAPTTALSQQEQVTGVCHYENSLDGFKAQVAAEEVAQPSIKWTILEGKDFQVFGDAIDRALRDQMNISGARDPAIKSVGFITPSENSGNETLMATFGADGCLLNMIPFPTNVIREALGQPA